MFDICTTVNLYSAWREVFARLQFLSAEMRKNKLVKSQIVSRNCQIRPNCCILSPIFFSLNSLVSTSCLHFPLCPHLNCPRPLSLPSPINCLPPLLAPAPANLHLIALNYDALRRLNAFRCTGMHSVALLWCTAEIVVTWLSLMRISAQWRRSRISPITGRKSPQR